MSCAMLRPKVLMVKKGDLVAEIESRAISSSRFNRLKAAWILLECDSGTLKVTP